MNEDERLRKALEEVGKIQECKDAANTLKLAYTLFLCTVSIGLITLFIFI